MWNLKKTVYCNVIFTVFFDEKNSDTSQRIADTVASMVENFIKQFTTNCKKVLLLFDTTV